MRVADHGGAYVDGGQFRTEGDKLARELAGPAPDFKDAAAGPNVGGGDHGGHEFGGIARPACLIELGDAVEQLPLALTLSVISRVRRHGT
jgi:hypothetical protein